MSGGAFEYVTRARNFVGAPETVQSQLIEERDVELETFLANMLGDGTWVNPLRLGGYALWIDGTGDLRIKASKPTSATDGTVVGTQT